MPADVSPDCFLLLLMAMMRYGDMPRHGGDVLPKMSAPFQTMSFLLACCALRADAMAQRCQWRSLDAAAPRVERIREIYARGR